MRLDVILRFYNLVVYLENERRSQNFCFVSGRQDLGIAMKKLVRINIQVSPNLDLSRCVCVCVCSCYFQ